MPSYNKVMLMGHLTRDPELKYTQSGAPIASFGLAVNRKFKQGDEWKREVCFVDITAWGKQAENCAEYLHKGSPAFVEGYLKFSSWQAEGSQKRSKLDVTANTVQFLGGGGDNKNNTNDEDVPF